MKDNDSKPKTQPSGDQPPPPRPPKRTAFALGPEDDDGDQRKQPKKQTVRINLPPKPSAFPVIKLPTLPPGQSVFGAAKLTKKRDIPALALATSQRPGVAGHNVELSMVLAAVLTLNVMLCLLRCL